MFMLRNVSKYLFGDATKEQILEIPQGQLYLVRPLSPKGYSELIYRDAAASIRRTGQPFQYQLVIQRVYEEGEEELLEDEDGEDSADAGLSNSEKDEKIYLLDESLHFRTDRRASGETVFAWRDLSGDVNDLYEFVCDVSTQSSVVSSFEVAAVQCQYERKYRKSAEHATDRDLKQFEFAEEEPIPLASPIKTPELSPTPTPLKKTDDMANLRIKRTPVAEVKTNTGRALLPRAEPTVAPPVAKHPEAREQLVSEVAELHMYDFESGSFVLQDSEVHATVFEVGSWNYWLQITSAKRDWIGETIGPQLNPVFNFEYKSFIFNHFVEDGSAYSWLLRFKDEETIEEFQGGLMQALWEHANETKWVKAKKDDQDYVMEAFNDLTMEDPPLEEDEDELHDFSDNDDGQRSEEYDDDEDQDDVQIRPKDGQSNSQLAVGYKHDRSFVVRGSAIGVFKHTADNNLEFTTNIAEVKTTKGKLFSPKKVMLHAEDSNMVIQSADNPHSLFRMDLETGKIVDEWKIDDDIEVSNFTPESKYAQMTGEQTFLGLSHNGLYRIDPRLAGNKLVQSELKQYASKNDFSAAATTANGYIAVASNKGDIRMFDRLGINAKTHLPALGDPIIGIDVSADGRWVLATTKTYLLLIDAQQKEGKNAGKLGFEKAFGKDYKPTPRRLTLSPSHVAQMTHETKTPVAFTAAHFNTGVDASETTIVTATGPFAIIWSMKKVLTKQREPYSIKRYGDVVKADNFKYGSDRNMIVALPDEVGMVKKAELRRPTRESIVGYGAGPSTPRRPAKTRGSYLRNEIVDSPY